MSNFNNEDWLDFVGSLLGASGAAFRLFVSLLFSYPMIFFYRSFLYNKAPSIQHIYFILCGSYIGYFNYGGELIHAYICIVVQYVVLFFTKGSLFSVVFSFIFQMGYLMAEYYASATVEYDIKWTIPHCVLTLRLIGQAFDIFDGYKNEKELSSDQKQVALKNFPTILESAGAVFFPASFMIGPQFSLKRYLDFVAGKFNEKGEPPSSVSPGLKRLLYGIIYISLFQTGSNYINAEYILGENFKDLSFVYKILYIGVYGRIMLYKYISCWIITEGAVILSGISHNGKNIKGEIQWNALENVNISIFEKAYKFGHVIQSFNKCTNLWVSQYVYKRLKFMGNRLISQGTALLFLAVWHGFHSGYYMTFFMEFLVMNLEKDLENILSKNPKCQKWHNSTIGFWIDVIVFKLLVTIFFGYCLIPFTMLKIVRWWPAYSEIYFFGTFIFGLWPLYKPLVKAMFRHSSSKLDKDISEKNANLPNSKLVNHNVIPNGVNSKLD